MSIRKPRTVYGRLTLWRWFRDGEKHAIKTADDVGAGIKLASK